MMILPNWNPIDTRSFCFFFWCGVGTITVCILSWYNGDSRLSHCVWKLWPTKIKYATMIWLQCIDNSLVGQWNWRRNEINETFYEPINEINHHEHLSHVRCCAPPHMKLVPHLPLSPIHPIFIASFFQLGRQKENISSKWSFKTKNCQMNSAVPCTSWWNERQGDLVRQFRHFIFAFERSGGKPELIYFSFIIFGLIIKRDTFSVSGEHVSVL